MNTAMKRWCFGILLALCAFSAPSQPAKPAPQNENTLSIDMLEQRKSQLEESKTVDDSTKAALVKLYNEAILELQKAVDFKTKIQEYEIAIKNASEQLKTTQQELTRPIENPAPDPNKPLPLEKIEEIYERAAAELEEAQRQVKILQDQGTVRIRRRLELPVIITKVKERLADIQHRVSTMAAAQSTDQGQAEYYLLLAREEAAKQELNLYETELRYYEATRELITTQYDLANLRNSQFSGKVSAWREALNRERAIKADEELRKAKEQTFEAAKEHAALRSLAAENTQLLERRLDPDGISQLKERAGRSLTQIDQQLKSLNNDYFNIKTRLETIGLTHGVGLLLRQQRAVLPDINVHKQAIRKRQNELSNVQMEWFELIRAGYILSDIEKETQVFVSTIDDVTAAVLPELTDRVRELLKIKRDHLRSLANEYSDYLTTLLNLDAAERTLVDKIVEVKQFIDKHVLWIRSTDWPKYSDFALIKDSILWLIDAEQWKAALHPIYSDCVHQPAVAILIFIWAGLVYYLRYKSKKTLQEIASRVKRKSMKDTFSDTLQALMFTAFYVVYWPAVMWLIGLWLSNHSLSTDWTPAISSALQQTAILFFILEFIQQICSQDELGEIHFRWPVERVKPIRAYLPWFMLVIVPLNFLFVFIQNSTQQNYIDTMGRMFFIIGLVCFLVFIRFAVSASAKTQPGKSSLLAGQSKRNHYASWYYILLLFPAILIVMSLMGYFYTAHQLMLRLAQTLGIILGLVLIGGIIQRWLFLTRRTLAIQDARKKLAAIRAEEGSGGEKKEQIQLSEQDLDLSTIDEQTRTLIRTFLTLTFLIGVYFIWIDMLPALEFLNQIHLWNYSTQVLNPSAVGGANQPDSFLLQQQAFTLKGVLFTLIIVFMTFKLTRNIPGLLEMLILQRLPFDRGFRYAFTSIARYLIVLVGIILVTNTLGVQWNHVQWLVAAMTVGLGFGLQEIFANFVAGIILLFERPIRIGDVVTVGDVTGMISRIQIRATTIVNWERKELIIPNKEFITGKVINWTLTDQIIRLIINVGVAYGSNINLVHEILRKIANDNPNVLKDPPPVAVFEAFGESTLDFTLRVFLPSTDLILQTRDSINRAIDREFREAGIEIAFPQRDIHIRSVDAPFLSNSWEKPERLKPVASED